MRFLDPLYYVERRNQPQGGGGKGGGGDSDASAMLAYGQKGIDLQKEIYDTNRADAQPWYQAGTASVNQLAKLMGLNGTGANSNPSSRQSLLDQYKDQFTTTNETTTEGTAGNPNWGPNTAYIMEQLGYRPSNFDIYQQNQGTAPVTTKTSTTDQAALNAYVDDLLAKQGAANESDPLFGSLAKNFSMDDFNADPGYQFRLGEGQKALERKLNASGKTYSPEAAKALMQYNQDFGSNEYNNSYNRFNIDQDNLFNRLATISGFGQTASGQVANSGTNYANAATEQWNGMGNAVTSANLANKANNSSMFNTLIGAGAQLGGAYLMSDERLKENIVPLGFENGVPVYAYQYKNSDNKWYYGAMAQEISLLYPNAVKAMPNGYLAVDYSQIPIHFRALNSKWSVIWLTVKKLAEYVAKNTMGKFLECFGLSKILRTNQRNKDVLCVNVSVGRLVRFIFTILKEGSQNLADVTLEKPSIIINMGSQKQKFIDCGAL